MVHHDGHYPSCCNTADAPNLPSSTNVPVDLDSKNHRVLLGVILSSFKPADNTETRSKDPENRLTDSDISEILDAMGGGVESPSH